MLTSLTYCQKTDFFQKIKLSILLINVKFKLKWSVHVKISCKMSNAGKKKLLCIVEKPK